MVAKGPETNDVEAKVAVDTVRAKAELQELQRLGAQVRRSLEGVRSSGGGPKPRLGLRSPKPKPGFRSGYIVIANSFNCFEARC